MQFSEKGRMATVQLDSYANWLPVEWIRTSHPFLIQFPFIDVQQFAMPLFRLLPREKGIAVYPLGWSIGRSDTHRQLVGAAPIILEQPIHENERSTNE
jgi:hypothetical protein